MDQKEKECWVAFNVFEGIGPLRFKLLLDYFGSAEKAYRAPAKKLVEIGLGEKLVGRFEEFRKDFDPSSYLLRVSQLGVIVKTTEDNDYPKLLKEISSSPPLIYAKLGVRSKELGDMSEIFEKKSVAVVGTRMPTPYGKKVTEMIIEGLVASGLIIVSGLARGIDRIAHEATINNKGLTVGVLGCGLDKVYPPEHKNLIDEIVKSGGAVISELPLGTMPVRGNFPARNRIISGLSLGVIVTEAAQDSGSLITASHAAEQGREVFAVPGPITSLMSKGTSELIKKGAKLVSGVEDILEELKVESHKVIKPESLEEIKNMTDEERKILEILKIEEIGIDEIIRKTGFESGKVGSLLSLLEIKGLIKNYQGIYSLKE